MLIGQDESTYHQFVFSSKQWKGPSGRNFILPKGDGEILMISGFQSREFGLGLSTLLSEDVMSAVNDLRKGKKYKAEDSAMLVHNTVYKNDIADNPLLRYFRAGMDNDGY